LPNIEQIYSIDDSDQCLIGTAEIPVGGLHMDSILSDSFLPLKYVAFSHCFRTEAGAAGTATRFEHFCYLAIDLTMDLNPLNNFQFFLIHRGIKTIKCFLLLHVLDRY